MLLEGSAPWSSRFPVIEQPYNSSVGAPCPPCCRRRRSSASFSNYFLKQRQTMRSSHLREARGMGLWIAIELNVPARPYCEALKELGVLCKDSAPRGRCPSKPIRFWATLRPPPESATPVVAGSSSRPGDRSDRTVPSSSARSPSRRSEHTSCATQSPSVRSRPLA